MKSRIDTLDQKNMELEDKIRKNEREKDQIWERAKD